MFSIFKKKNKQKQREEIWDKFVFDLGLCKLSDLKNGEKKEIFYVYTYFSEILNGGHLQYFINHQDFNYEEVIDTFKNLFSEELFENFCEALDLFTNLKLAVNNIEDYVDEEMEDYFKKNDQIFFENENFINKLLTDYATKV